MTEGMGFGVPMSTKVLLVFALTELLVSLTPGPAVFPAVSQEMRDRSRQSARGLLAIEMVNVSYAVV